MSFKSDWDRLELYVMVAISEADEKCPGNNFERARAAVAVMREAARKSGTRRSRRPRAFTLVSPTFSRPLTKRSDEDLWLMTALLAFEVIVEIDSRLESRMPDELKRHRELIRDMTRDWLREKGLESYELDTDTEFQGRHRVELGGGDTVGVHRYRIRTHYKIAIKKDTSRDIREFKVDPNDLPGSRE